MLINAYQHNIPISHPLFNLIHRAEATLTRPNLPPESMNRAMRRHFLNRHGRLSYLVLFRSHNRELFSYLTGQGFFEFHATNNGEIVNLQQIVAYFFCGGRQAYLNRFTCSQSYQEVHHYNGDSQDCRPFNLVYVTTSMHKIITRHQRGAFVDIPGHYFPDLSTNLTPIWNRRGARVRNPHRFLANIIALTLRSTFQWLHNCQGYLLGVVHWINRIVSHLEAGLDTSFIPNPTFIPVGDSPNHLTNT
jgi:hypothetical protein